MEFAIAAQCDVGEMFVNVIVGQVDYCENERNWLAVRFIGRSAVTHTLISTEH